MRTAVSAYALQLKSPVRQNKIIGVVVGRVSIILKTRQPPVLIY